MKRFIRYLYEYQEGKRTRNVGFVKVEAGADGTTVHIHGKGLRLEKDCALVVYLFYEEHGKCIGILQGETSSANPTVNHRLWYTPEDTGVPENYQRLQGILLKSSTGRTFAATWEECELDVSQMTIWTPEEPETEPEQMQVCEELQEKVSEQIHIHKIQRHELSRLARCDWHLSNNQFLMHGYYNYRHLGLIKGEDGWKLGVPGNWHEEEAQAARIFGFKEFLPIEKAEVSLTAEERNDEEQFGYWCRNVKMCRSSEKR